MNCTHCDEPVATSVYLTARPNNETDTEYVINLCASCIITAFPTLVGHLQGKDFDKFVKDYGKTATSLQVESQVHSKSS